MIRAPCECRGMLCPRKNTLPLAPNRRGNARGLAIFRVKLGVDSNSDDESGDRPECRGGSARLRGSRLHYFEKRLSRWPGDDCLSRSVFFWSQNTRDRYVGREEWRIVREAAFQIGLP